MAWNPSRTTALKNPISISCIVIVCIGFVVAATVERGRAYDFAAHEVLGTLAGDASSIDAVLRDELGFPSGRATTFQQGLQSRTFSQWIGRGALEEDIPDFRVLNHFHDPLADWANAGLTVLERQLGQSSVLWQQNENQDGSLVTLVLPFAQFRVGGGNWSWPDARRAFVDALTKETAEDRNAGLVDSFLTLGHLTHLIQDATVPAHVRNDQHLKKGFIDFSDGYEKFVNDNVALIPGFAASVIEPQGLEFSAKSGSAAPGPVARLLDTDLFTGLNADILASRSIGIAEYTNGNFLSQDTLFRPYALPREESLRPQELVAEGGGQRQYFRKLFDGEPVEFFVAKGTLFDQLLLRGSVLKNYLVTNRSNNNYAAKLLPRAVGYSAALINYFFRGTLSAGIDESGTDPVAVVQNTSKEPLANGSLTIYADLASGQRVSVSEPVTVTALPAGEAFPNPIPLGAQASNATRFVAVYRGDLGQETNSVIGKVFNTERVEEIFAGAEQWQIRTPRGVFVLPLRVAEWTTVKWGDSDNMILAVAPLRANTAMPLVGYSLERLPDSGDFVTDGSGGMVVLTEVARTSFPLNSPVTLATVNFNQVFKYRQQIGRYNAHWTETWVPTGTAVNPFDGFYNTTSYATSGLVFQPLHEAEIPFAASFAVKLDDAHNANVGIVRDPYSWRFVEFFVTTEGKILATVIVNPGVPPGSAVTVPVYMLNDGTEKIPFGSQTRTMRPFFPAQIGPLLWALVSLTDGTVIASTAEPVINLSSTELIEGPPYDNVVSLACGICPPALYRHMTHEYAGGPSAGTVESHEVAILHARSTQTDGLPQMTAETGQRAFGGSELFRGDLRQALATEQFADFSISVTAERRVAWNFDCNTPFCTTDAGFAAFEAIGKTYGTPRPPAQLRTVRRPAPTPNGERLVVLADSVQGGLRPLGKLAVWDHEAEAAKIGLTIPAGFHSLPFVTAERAVVYNDAPSGGTSGSYLVDLMTPSGNGSKTAFFPLTDLRFGFTLLDADHLYNTSDFRFYRPTPPLTATRLPAVLAPVTGNPTGSYHIFKVR